MKKTRVLFVGSQDMGMSRIAEGLLRYADPNALVSSAGVDVDPDDRGVNQDARQAMAEIGARCDGDPVQLTASVADRQDVVIVVGNVDTAECIAPDCSEFRWVLEDPANRGITGIARYRVLRDELKVRIHRMVDGGYSPEACRF
ncbi:hypothetical protein [Corynebacterium sputi]|uniref:hypothetical protein n=1 Tax=Corynebacterium sputi TaxID=489915 RepID=UPI00047DE254|nr:hypothetical protein [Corynebacterium sputi]